MTFNIFEVVDARQVTEDKDAALVTAEWCGGILVEEIDPFDRTITPGINVPTLRGVKRASITDYVVANVYDEFEVVNKHMYESELQKREDNVEDRDLPAQAVQDRGHQGH